MAPNHAGIMQPDIIEPRNSMGAERFNTRPRPQTGNGNVNSRIPNRVTGSTSRIPNFGSPSGSKTFQFDSLRMYEFKKHRINGRKLDWEIANRRMIPSPDSELNARIIKPAKDNRGLSSRRDFNSSGMSGYKQQQSQQLLEDLQRHDQRFEWQLELIELHDLGFSSETGKVVCSKMILIVSRNPRKGHMLAPGIMWPLGEAVVDLGPHLRQSGPMYRSAGGQQGWPMVDQSKHGGLPAQNVGQSSRPNIDSIHHPRPTPLYNILEEHGNQGPQKVFQPGQGQRGIDKNDARMKPMYNLEEKHSQPQTREVQESGHTGKGKSKKDGKKEKPTPIIEIPTPKVYHDDSDSSSDRDSAFDGNTFRSSDTEISIDSPRSDKKYFGQKDLKPKKQTGKVPEASREHYRKNPTEYMQESRKRYEKDDVVIEPASRRRHQGSTYPRSPSFTRGRPSPAQADRFEDDFRQYDNSPPRRRVSIHDRRLAPRIDPRDEAESERERSLQLELENLRLERELKDRDLREEILREEIMKDELLRKERLRDERVREERLREREWARYDDKYRPSRYKPSYL